MIHNLRHYVLLMSLLTLLAGAVFPHSTLARVPESEEEIKLSYAPIVRSAAPAVVNVYVRHKAVQKQFRSPLFRDPFFRHFFGDKLNRHRKNRMKNSLGSGVILRPNGIVVTNYHVIKGG